MEGRGGCGQGTIVGLCIGAMGPPTGAYTLTPRLRRVHRRLSDLADSNLLPLFTCLNFAVDTTSLSVRACTAHVREQTLRGSTVCLLTQTNHPSKYELYELDTIQTTRDARDSSMIPGESTTILVVHYRTATPTIVRRSIHRLVARMSCTRDRVQPRAHRPCPRA